MARSTTPADPWHYPRPKLAAKYLQVFDVGLTSARALFAKRRMGKSEFLEQDLIPAARKAGYLTAYLNLWDARSQPAPAFLAALTRALRPTGLRKLAKTLKRPLKSIKASAKVAGMAEGSFEAELGGTDTAATPRLTELIPSFDKPNRRMLLVLDKAQVLAESAHTDRAHSLRASLDRREQDIKVMCVGGSERRAGSMRLSLRTCRNNRCAGYRTPTWCCEWITETIGCRMTPSPSGCEIVSSRIEVHTILTSALRTASA